MTEGKPAEIHPAIDIVMMTAYFYTAWLCQYQEGTLSGSFLIIIFMVFSCCCMLRTRYRTVICHSAIPIEYTARCCTFVDCFSQHLFLADLDEVYDFYRCWTLFFC